MIILCFICQAKQLLKSIDQILTLRENLGPRSYQGRLLLSDKDVENTEEDQRSDNDADLFYQDEITAFNEEEWGKLFGKSQDE